jgi:hypothetical protein
MKMAIMQPYFFPYIGQFNLIHAVDRFILCDDVPYIRHGWINRNRMLKFGEGVQYITAPVVKCRQHTAISDVRIVVGRKWKEDIARQIGHYRKMAPYYTVVSTFLADCLRGDETVLAKLNAHCMQAVCDYIGLSFSIELSSGLGLDYAGVTGAQDWALTICQQLGATEYYNPPGGMELYNKASFDDKGLGLRFVKPILKPYDQGRPSFEQGLSILDIMMFNAPSAIRGMLNEYEII